MKKQLLVVTFLALVALFSLSGANQAFAYKYNFCTPLGESYFDWQGYVENWTAVRMHDKWETDPNDPTEPTRQAGDLAMSRNTMRLKYELGLGQHLMLVGLTRISYEGSYDYNIHHVSQASRHEHIIEDALDGNIFREYYAVLTFPEWTIKAGAQQLVWGETDILRMADQWNPLDLSWDMFLPNWEEIRIPRRMIVVTYAPAKFITHNLSLEAVVIPEDFRPKQYPYEGANSCFWLNPWSFYRTAFTRSVPTKGHISNGEYGFRARGVMGPVEASVYYMNKRYEGLIIDLDKFVGYLTGNHGIDFCNFPKYNIVGMTANWDENKYTRTVWRWECGYFIHEPTNDRNFAMVKRDSWNFMFGFDRPTFWKWLNPTNTFFLSFQWFHKEFLDWDKGNGLVSATQSNDRVQDMIIGLIQGQWFNNNLTPTLAFAYDPSGSWLWLPNIKYILTSNWSFMVGFDYFGKPEHNRSDSFMGAYGDNDQAWFKVRYSFK
jgi:hypothetical protein